MSMCSTQRVFSVLRSVASSSMRRGACPRQVHRSFSICTQRVTTKPFGQPVSAHVGCSRYNSSASGLADFLKEEIEAETEQAQQHFKGSPAVSGFKVSNDESDVTLEKDHGSEKIIVKFNVNHTVDMQAYETPEDSQQEQGSPMLSKPHFSVEVGKGDQKLVFDCSFPPVSQEEMPAEEVISYGIDEIYMYKGDASEKVYAVGGEILDGNLYDYFLNYLEERGINDQFANDLIQFSTHYEHSQYVALLHKIRDFVSK